MGKAKQTDKNKAQQAQSLPKLDVKQVLEDYSLAELKYQACENHLLGNFDKDKNYKILDIIYPELINIQKVLGKRTSGFYTASCYVEQTNLNFVVKIERLEENRISATLLLQEKLVFAKNFETTISTPLKTITDIDTPDFAFKVRSAFHLVNADDVDEMSLFENYVSPPIELVTELIKKAEMLDVLKPGREKFETEYLSSVLKALKKTEEGTLLVKNFFAIVKQNGLHEEKENRNQRFKELLDYLIDEKIAENALPEETVNEVAQARNAFVVESKKESFNLMQTKSKSGFKGFLGVKKNLSKEIAAPIPAPKAPEKEKSAQSQSSSPSSGGASSGGSKDKKEDKKTQKSDKYTPIFAPLGEKPKSKIHKPFWADVHMPNHQQEKEQSQPQPPQPQPNNEPSQDSSLKASILGRAMQDGDKTTFLVVKQTVVETEYMAALQVGVSNNHGVSVGVRVKTQEIQTEMHEVEIEK